MLRYADQSDGDKNKMEKDFDRPESPSYFDQLSKNIPWYHRILLNNVLRVVLVMGIVAIVVPPIVFFFLYENIHRAANVSDGLSTGTCSHNETHRVKCGVENATLQQCSPNCCYDDERNFCYHYMPSRFSYISRNGWSETSDLTPRISTTPYDSMQSIPIVRLHVEEMSDSQLKIVIYDASKLQFKTGDVIANKKYSYRVFYTEVFIEVYSADIEKSVTKPLLTTVRGPLIASKNIWEWSFHMGDDVVYGMGELAMKPNKHKLIYNTNDTSSAVPFIMSQRNGTFSGLLIEQYGPLQINITDSKVVSVKSFSGDSIGVHYFFGPKPEDVSRQLIEYLGKTESLPYWALGVHFCRSEAKKTNATWMLEKYYNFTELANIEKLPYDSDCISDDLFQYINFDLNNTELQFVEDEVSRLHGEGRHFFATLRPHIKFDNKSEMLTSAINEGILFLNPYGFGPLEGIVDGEIVYFPDYSMNKTVVWMQDNWPFGNLTSSFVLKDNWPRNDDYNINCTVNLPYLTQEIKEKFCMSIPWNTTNSLKNSPYHMDSHNIYGMSHAASIKNCVDALNTDQSKQNGTDFVLSSSQYISDRAGSNVQNVNTTWETMKLSFRRAVGKSITGFAVQSIPVCGDTPVFDVDEMEHICIKWYLASVTLPIFRVLSCNVSRDPLSFSGYAKNALKSAISTRYSLLPYYYKYLSENKPLMRPMFYDFYNDNNTYSIEDQYMVGDALLAVPSFAPHQSTLRAYIPVNETFYDLWGGNRYAGENGNWFEIATAETELLVLLRGGNIIALQENTDLTAEQTRLSSNYTLIVAITCDAGMNQSCSASGSLFIVNNTYWTFDATNETLVIDPNLSSSRQHVCATSPDDKIVTSSVIDKIKVYGLNGTLNNFEDYFMLTGINIDLCVLGDTETLTLPFK